MRICTIVIYTVALLALGGCASASRVPTGAPASTSVPVVAVLSQKPAGATVVGPVSATTCLNRLWDRRAGWDAALDAAKVQAGRQGANALLDVEYEEGEALLCPSSLKVSGTALRLSR